MDGVVEENFVGGYRAIPPDAATGSRLVAKLANCIMHGGKKSVAIRVVHDALTVVESKLQGMSGVQALCEAIENVKPQIEVRSKRVGGATYQVPTAVNPKRRQTLAIRWLIEAARSRSGRPMSDRLAEEISAAVRREGAAYTKRENVHKMADANKAFSHFG